MKNWAKWLLLTLWTLGLIFTAQYWNPFTSFPALMKYSVISIIGAAILGALVMLMQYYIVMNVIFPLPPRADSNAPKTLWHQMFSFLFKDPPIDPKAPKTLTELVGNEKAKKEIQEVIDMLKNREHYLESGADVPKGMMFIGPPGVGKTLFARAIANEASIPFYVVEGGSFSGIIWGLGTYKLKMLFQKLRRHDRAILFIDEIETMGARRQQDRGAGAQADMNMTLNSLLIEMDGFQHSRVLIIGATNNDSVLDPALMRAGRFDRRVYFEVPPPDDRRALFQYYLSKVLADPEIKLDEIVELTSNYSPAEISRVVNEAALISRRPGGPNKVTTEMIKTALERVAVGLERTLTSGVELIAHDPRVRLDDVIGIDDVKQEVAEIVHFLKAGDDLRKIGAKVPKGIMMIGPPGVGKSMLAKAIANEAGVPFFGISASFFSSMWQGEGAARIRALYNQARKNTAAIVFIDEIDALAGTVNEMGTKRTTELNQILVELDGIGISNVITLGATNMEQKLDPAFLRSGRFDRKVYIGLPDAEARKKIFQAYLKKIKIEEDHIDLDELGKLSFNFSGADISAAVNEAAMLAVRKGRMTVEEDDLEEACSRVSVTAGHKLNTSGISMSRVPDLDVKLDDIKGMEEAKSEAHEVVHLLKNADLVARSGLKYPKGVLLIGPPGTGKTMLAKAIANEAGVSFYALSGTDFNQVWVGLGAQRVRSVYEQARRSGKPAIVFIDEIDAIGATRREDTGAGGRQEMNNTLNALLVEMDGFGKHKVLTIGATNSADLLDDALTRPGRFDRQIEISLPNLEGRLGILEHYFSKLEMERDVNILEIARMTVFSSGADLANIVNEAGLTAIRNGRVKIIHPDCIHAIQRVFFGMHRTQNVTLQDLWETAYHECGHTIVSYFKNQLNRIQVVTIIPSGRALGYMWDVAKDDYFHHSMNKSELLANIEVGLGGYAAEMLYKGENTQGVSADLSNVARTVSNMVRYWGMGRFKFNTNAAFENRRGSAETEREIEQDIKDIVDGCLQNVDLLLRSKRAELDRMAAALIERETLYYHDIVEILEPSKTRVQIEEEIATLSERKLVGRKALLDVNFIESLKLVDKGKRKKGKSNGNGNGNGNGYESQSGLGSVGPANEVETTAEPHSDKDTEKSEDEPA